MNKFTKKIILTALATGVLASFNVSADNNVSVLLNGDKMSFDVEPIIKNDRVLVPFRNIFEAFGCNVSFSQYDGASYVYANNGDAYITLEIGKKEIVVDENTIELDVAPEIVDDRTLVPLRAVSEALKSNVSWDNNTRTVSIEKFQGQYKIINKKIEKKVYSDDNVLLMNVSANYPVFVSDDELVSFDHINDFYKDKAEKFVENNATEHKNGALELSQILKDEFIPYEASSNYKVTINRGDWLSVMNTNYYNLGGPHPIMVCDSQSYQTFMGSSLSLTDVLCKEQDEVNKIVYDKFAELICEFDDLSQVEHLNTLKENLDRVNFYIANDKVILYFNQYDILPYAYGVPSVELDFDKGEVGIDLAGYNKDAYEFDLDGNYTTGYRWSTAVSDESIISVEDTYIPDSAEEGMVGVGGKAHFVVKGLKQGVATLTCTYERSWEENSGIEGMIYKFYVSEDNKVTLLSQRNKNIGGEYEKQTYNGKGWSVEYSPELFEVDENESGAVFHYKNPQITGENYVSVTEIDSNDPKAVIKDLDKKYENLSEVTEGGFVTYQGYMRSIPYDEKTKTTTSFATLKFGNKTLLFEMFSTMIEDESLLYELSDDIEALVTSFKIEE